VVVPVVPLNCEGWRALVKSLDDSDEELCGRWIGLKGRSAPPRNYNGVADDVPVSVRGDIVQGFTNVLPVRVGKGGVSLFDTMLRGSLIVGVHKGLQA